LSVLSQDRHRIAVLSLTNTTPDPRDEYFTDGMTDELIPTLSKVASPRVIARTAIIQYPKEHELIGQSARRREKRQEPACNQKMKHPTEDSMTRYLVEVPHENTKVACDRAIRLFQETGSHFVTNADWGCSDNVHKAWFVAEADSREEAVAILPPLFRQSATIVALQRFGKDDLVQSSQKHPG